jgi:hypothetical protein
VHAAEIDPSALLPVHTGLPLLGFMAFDNTPFHKLMVATVAPEFDSETMG